MYPANPKELKRRRGDFLAALQASMVAEGLDASKLPDAFPKRLPPIHKGPLVPTHRRAGTRQRKGSS